MSPEDKKKISDHFRAAMAYIDTADKPLEGCCEVDHTPRALLERDIESGKLFDVIEEALGKSGKSVDEFLAQNSPKNGPLFH